jgi:HD-like signal output (HDOD) protein
MQVEHAEPADVEEAHIAGMLHDLGKLMLADSMPDRFQKALALASEQQLTSEKAEFEIFGADHSGAAAYLLSLWGLPVTIVEAVAFHHVPSGRSHTEFGVLTAVHVADVIEHQLATEPSACPLPVFDSGYLAAAGVQDRIEEWRNVIIEEFASASDSQAAD